MFPPLGLTCLAAMTCPAGVPSTVLQYVANKQWADPVTGSSGTPNLGAKTREMKLVSGLTVEGRVEVKITAQMGVSFRSF